MLKLITETTKAAEEATAVTATLDDLARVGAQRMIAAALQIEVDDYLARFRDARDAAGHARVVRNGTARARPVLTGVGPLTIAAPRVNDRRSPRVESVLPLLYLHGLSSGDFREALPALLGPDAAGLSSSAILRLTKVWTTEYEAFRHRDLADRDYIYLWADGIHFRIRLEEERLCAPPDRRAPGRDQGSRRARGRLPGECGELAHAAAGSQTPGAAGPGAGGRRRRAGILGGRARGLAGDGGAALLGTSSRERAGQAPEESPAARAPGAARNHVRRDAGGRRARDRALRAGVRRQVSQGRRVADRRSGPPPGVLRLPGGTLEASA